MNSLLGGLTAGLYPPQPLASAVTPPWREYYSVSSSIFTNK